ncbi:MAG: thioredoxin-disulfide reductase [Pseudomonadota bacterium]
MIIGGGPAGLTAGLYAARARLTTKLLERIAPGGQVMNTHWVDNYPGFPEGVSGFELVDRMRSQAERFGLEISRQEVVSLARDGKNVLVKVAGGTVSARSVIVASGSQPIKIGVPGELELAGKGVSYCATCDGPFFRDVEVAVVGGGDTAVQEALFLTRFSSRVHLFHRRDELRATGILREKVQTEPKVEMHWSSVLTQIRSGGDGLVNGVSFKDLKTGRASDLPVSGVFFFVGQKPMTEYLEGFVELDASGFVIADPEMRTSQPGVFAAGDARAKRFRQIATAVGDGATAAFTVEKYLEDEWGGTD